MHTRVRGRGELFERYVYSTVVQLSPTHTDDCLFENLVPID